MAEVDHTRLPLQFGAGRTAVAIRVHAPDELAGALVHLGLGEPRPVVVVVGGAGGLDGDALHRLRVVFADALVPAITAVGAVAVDGGTHVGVMRLLGEVRADRAAGFPLLGVAAEGTVILPGGLAVRDDAAPLDPHHSHFLLVPGKAWGDESGWLARAATSIAGPAASATVLINGGDISFTDVANSLAENRPVLVLDGTGRTADRIAAAARGERDDPRTAELAASPLLRIVPIDDIPRIRAALSTLLSVR